MTDQLESHGSVSYVYSCGNFRPPAAAGLPAAIALPRFRVDPGCYDVADERGVRRTDRRYRRRPYL